MLNDVVGEGVVTALLLAAKLGFVYIAIMWAALIYWTFRDIHRRTHDIVYQGVAILLSTLFFLPGYWLYLVLRPRQTLAEVSEERFREALFAEYSDSGTCPKCHKRTREEFVACPYCQAALRSACTGCSRALLASWKTCPYCRVKVPSIHHVPQLQEAPGVAAAAAEVSPPQQPALSPEVRKPQHRKPVNA